MRIALISDIHANHTALARVLECAEQERVEGIAFLGDYVCDFPHPLRTLDMIYALRRQVQTWHIRGNRDEYMLERRRGEHPDWTHDSGSGSLLYTYESLRECDLDFFEGLSHIMEIRLDGRKPFTICHGSPFRSRDMICYNDARIRASLRAVATDQLFLGHAHAMKRLGDGGRTAHFIGSAGLPDGYGGMTQFAVIDDASGDWEIRHIMVPYDVEAALAEFEDAGLYERAGMWARAVAIMARTGHDAPGAMVRKVRAIACEEGAAGFLREDHFCRAAREMGIC